MPWRRTQTIFVGPSGLGNGGRGTTVFTVQLDIRWCRRKCPTHHGGGVKAPIGFPAVSVLRILCFLSYYNGLAGF